MKHRRSSSRNQSDHVQPESSLLPLRRPYIGKSCTKALLALSCAKQACATKCSPSLLRMLCWHATCDVQSTIWCYHHSMSRSGDMPVPLSSPSLSVGVALFRKNGKLLGTAFRNVPPLCFYPTIGMHRSALYCWWHVCPSCGLYCHPVFAWAHMTANIQVASYRDRLLHCRRSCYCAR